MSDSDKHCAYLEDPDDVGLHNEFSGLSEDEVDDLKRVCLFLVFISHASG